MIRALRVLPQVGWSGDTATGTERVTDQIRIKKMKKKIFYLVIILFTMCKISMYAQCDIAELTIRDSAVFKSVRGYISNVAQRDPTLLENLINKKTQIVLMSETKQSDTDGIDKRVLSVGICDNNYFKYHKMAIIGYFHIDNVLFLVTTTFMGMFQTDSYDYENICLKKILVNHKLKEYDPPKRMKKMMNNVEIETRDMGGKLNSYECSIVLGVGKDAGYKLLYGL